MTAPRLVRLALLATAAGVACSGTRSGPDALAVVVSISPAATTVAPLGHQRFTASVTGAPDVTVIWSVREGAQGGTVTADGAYTAPAHFGSYHVVATSVTDSNRSATASVTVIDPATSGLPAACQSLADSRLAEGRRVVAKPALPRPAKGAYFRDPAFGTCVVRATDHAAEGFDPAAPNFMRGNYSRRQAFNADNTKLLVTDSTSNWVLLDALTLRTIRQLPELGGDDTSNEPQWDPTRPDVVFFRYGWSTTLHELDVSTGEITLVKDFRTFVGRPDGLPAAWSALSNVHTRYEGSPSADGRYWCFIAESPTGVLGLFSWDMQLDRIDGTFETSVQPDHISTSPSGSHCVPSWDDGTWAYERIGFASGWRLLEGSEHSDLAIGADGDDHYVVVDFRAESVVAVNLRTRARFAIISDIYQGGGSSWHISGKGFGKPGWVVVGAYRPDTAWFGEKISIVEITPGNPRVYQLAHHHTVYSAGSQDVYEAEPHASPSRDLTRVLFNSNWDTAPTSADALLDAVDAYIVFVPAGSFP